MIEKRKRKISKGYQLDNLKDTNPDNQSKIEYQTNVEILKVFPSIKLKVVKM